VPTGGFALKGNRPVFACTVRPTICNVAKHEDFAMTELTRRAALAGVAATTLMQLTMAAPARAAAA